MAFTRRKITHTFTNADLTPASGTVTFTLSGRMTNGSETIVPAAVTANLNAEGKIAQELTANNDPATIPSDTQWRVDFRILGAQTESFAIVVPTGAGTTDLGELLPKQPQGG